MKALLGLGLVSLLGFLTACGFHLRTEPPLPSTLSPLYLDSPQPYGPFEKALRRELRLAGIALTDQPAEAKIRLKFLSREENTTQITSSPGSQSTQYGVALNVTYEIQNAAGKRLIGPQSASASTSYSLNSNQILASQNQQEEVFRQLRERVIEVIFRQLNASKTQKALASQ